MSNLREWFRDRFGADLPLAIDGPLEQRGAETAWATPGLSLPSLPMVPEFLEQASRYVLAGEWGRGTNTFAFYFVDRRSKHRRFLRIFSGGGAYGSPSEASAELLAYLRGYEAWRAAHEASVETSEIVHNLGVSKAELTLKSGKTVTLAKMDEDGAFWTLLSDAMAG